MNYTEWIGYAAASLTTASFVPQAWLTFKTRESLKAPSQKFA
jgi:MtN3 and saliva related transmembrane protein